MLKKCSKYVFNNISINKNFKYDGAMRNNKILCDTLNKKPMNLEKAFNDKLDIIDTTQIEEMGKDKIEIRILDEIKRVCEMDEVSKEKNEIYISEDKVIEKSDNKLIHNRIEEISTSIDSIKLCEEKKEQAIIKVNKSISLFSFNECDIIFGNNSCTAALKPNFRIIENIYILSNYRGILI